MNHQENGMRLAIVVNGNEQRIINGKVYIPFGSEYSVRIVNSNNLRSKVQLSIDGMKEDEWFVIDPNNSITINRFMCGNLNSGNSFKFVKQNDSRVNDSTNVKNGIISVQCLLEKISNNIGKINKPIPWTQPYTPYYPWPYQPYIRWSPYEWYYDDAQYTTTWSACNTILHNSSCQNNVSLCCNQSQEGATIGGDEINQQFYNVEDFKTETNSINLSIKLMGKN